MRNLNHSKLDSDQVGSLLFKLALPSFMGMFVVTLYNVVNTIFIGHYIGPLGIAGLSIVFPFQVLGMGVGQITGIGGASLISRLLGSGNTQKAEKTLGNAITFNIILSLIISVAGLVNPDFWLKLCGASPTILPYARDYMTIIFMGMTANTFAMSLNGLSVSEGNTRLPMIAQISGAILNIILDYILIIVLEMGVKGAAIGTVISQCISAAIFLSYYLSGKSYLKIRLKNMVLEFKIIREMLAIGISALATTLASSITGILVMRMLLSYGGDLAVSTFGVISRLMMFSMMPGMVVGQGLQPIIGYNYGAKRYDRVLKGLKIGIIASTAICTTAFLILFISPEPFVRVFTTDVELISRSVYAIHRAFFFMYLLGFLMVGSITFQALGKATQSFITSIARSALFLIPCLYILGHFWQLEGIWMTYPQ